MPYTSEFTADGAGVLQRGSGTLTVDELVAVTISVGEAGEQLSRVRYVLADLSETTKFVGAPKDLMKLADFDVSLSKLIPDLAFVVVASMPVMFGIARMWEALSHQTGWRVMVVHTREEALDWLRQEVPGVTLL